VAANYLCKFFPYDLTFSHNTSVTNDDVDGQTDRQTTTVLYGRLKCQHIWKSTDYQY